MKTYQNLESFAMNDLKYILFLVNSMLHNYDMRKNKIQNVIYFNDSMNNENYYLLLLTNEQRGSFWQNITGSVEKGESFLEALIRETKEETAIDLDSIDFIKKLDMKINFIDQYQNEVTEKAYLTKVKSMFNPKLDSHEHVDFKWIKESEITHKTYKYSSNYQVIKQCILSL